MDFRLDNNLLFFLKNHQDDFLTEKLIKAYQPIILSMTFKYLKRFPEIGKEDLVQLAELALLKCLQKTKFEFKEGGAISPSFGFPKYLRNGIFFEFQNYLVKNLHAVAYGRNSFKKRMEMGPDVRKIFFQEQI